MNIEVTPFCGACTPLLDVPKGGASAFVYGGPVAEAIRRLKYAGRSDLAQPLGELLSAAARSHLGRVDVVIPVPLHHRRLRQRGYNQAALLGRYVARHLHLPLDTRRLRRIRYTAPQVELQPAQRQDNVRDAFTALRRPRQPRVLLVDDVRTTGATLQAAATALQATGCDEVRFLTLAGTE